MFIVIPSRARITNESIMEVGIAIATKEAVRTPRKNRRTDRIRMSPEMMLFSRLLTIMKISRDWSPVMNTSVVGGKRGSISARRRFTSSETSMMFAPERFTTSIVTTWLPFRRA